MSVCHMLYLASKKCQRDQGLQEAQKEIRQSIMYWEIEGLGVGLAH